MLYLYQSNRLENLARVFTGLQKLMPPENPLAAEEIVVQSQGMRRFLNLHLAKELGVAANLKFSLPAGLTWRLMRECLPGLPELSPFAPEGGERARAHALPTGEVGARRGEQYCSAAD